MPSFAFYQSNAFFCQLKRSIKPCTQSQCTVFFIYFTFHFFVILYAKNLFYQTLKNVIVLFWYRNILRSKLIKLHEMSPNQKMNRVRLFFSNKIWKRGFTYCISSFFYENKEVVGCWFLVVLLLFVFTSISFTESHFLLLGSLAWTTVLLAALAVWPRSFWNKRLSQLFV